MQLKSALSTLQGRRGSACMCTSVENLTRQRCGQLEGRREGTRSARKRTSAKSVPLMQLRRRSRSNILDYAMDFPGGSSCGGVLAAGSSLIRYMVVDVWDSTANAL